MSAPGDHRCDAITFAALREADFPRLTRWLAEPHVRRFYQKSPITLEEVALEYGPALRGEEPGHCHLAVGAGRPFGYLQCYRNVDYPRYAALIGAFDGFSIDLYIGEPEFLRRGWGRAMLRAYLAQVAFVGFPETDAAYIAHDLRNAAALNCSRAVGFLPLRRLMEGGVETQLLRLRRRDFSMT
jgi:aminoglycoside 6'-N-acetyltransferase